jgi:hypothetical protein
MSARAYLAILIGLVLLALPRIASAQVGDVTAPGDPIILVNGLNDGDTSSGPPPAGEIVDHAIDNVRQKYLNFLDLGSGFIVTPSRGSTILTGLRLYTANDAVERDPASYLLEGSNTGTGGPWIPISSGPLFLPSGRNITTAPFSGLTPIDAATDFQQTLEFINILSYASYRLTFPTLKDAPLANSMQIAEVEFLAPVPEPAALSLLALAFPAICRRRRRQ